MSFDEDEKKFGNNNPDDNDFYKLDDESEENNNSGDDFFKDEDFEFEGYDDEKEPEREGIRSKRTKQRGKKRKAIFRITAILLVLILAAAAIVFGAVPWIKNRFFSKPVITEEERITIPDSLILGEDINIVFACASGNLDEPDVNTIIFSSYYSSDNKLISLCIPPRTLMDIPGVGAELIGRSVNIQGMDLLNLALKSNLGMNMEIDYYGLCDVLNAVNKLGGIDLELAEEVSVKNYSDNSTFTLEKGNNLVDGAEALNFLKYFSGMEKDVPIENIKNQKLIVDALIRKIAGKNEEEMSANLNLVKDFMDTDLSMEDSLKIFSTLSGIDSGKNYTHALSVSSTELGGEDIVYIPQDIAKLAEIFSKEGISTTEESQGFTETVKITILNGAGSKNLREDEIISSDIIIILGKDYLAITEGSAENEELEEQLTKIIVLNGEGTAGLAATVTSILDDYFNSAEETVVMLEPRGAANFNYTETEITVFNSNERVNGIAQKIQERLGVGAIGYSDNNVDSVDISVTIGSDY